MGSVATKRTVLAALMTTITLVFAPAACAEHPTSLDVSTIGCVDLHDERQFVTIDLECLSPEAGSAPPEAPWGLAAVPMADESATVLLTWQTPLNDGGSPISELVAPALMLLVIAWGGTSSHLAGALWATRAR